MTRGPFDERFSFIDSVRCCWWWGADCVELLSELGVWELPYEPDESMSGLSKRECVFCGELELLSVGKRPSLGPDMSGFIVSKSGV